MALTMKTKRVKTTTTTRRTKTNKSRKRVEQTQEKAMMGNEKLAGQRSLNTNCAII